MPTIADYHAFFDGQFSLPVEGSGDIDVDHNFNAPDLSPEQPPILFFRVSSFGPATLQVILNGSIIVGQDFGDLPEERSYHEQIPGNLLRATNNTLTVTRTAGPGTLRLADFVIFFQANI